MSVPQLEYGSPVVLDEQTQGCIRLWAAVLKEGCEAAALAHFQEEWNGPDLRWFQSDDWGIGSFNWICDVLSIDAARARGLVRANFRSIINASIRRSKTAVRTQMERKKPADEAVRHPDAPDIGFDRIGNII